MKNHWSVRKRFTPEERAALLRSYHQSGLTQRAFVAQAGISLGALAQWLRSSRESAATFVELPPSTTAALPSAGYQLEFPGGVKLHIPAGFASTEAAELCRMARAL